jgi:hypothetical protein
VPVVPGVLLNHVLEDPPQRGRAGRSRCKIIQAVTLDGCASPVNAGMVGGQVRVSTCWVDQVKLAGTIAPSAPVRGKIDLIPTLQAPRFGLPEDQRDALEDKAFLQPAYARGKR